MKSSFALLFSLDGIRLLSRASGGWRSVGETDFESGDLKDALAYLRDKARRLSANGVTTKLVIPNAQILYTSVTAPGPDDASRAEQIRSSLEGMTPYPVDELTFDWRENGDLVQVAAVANETLEEAEAFACDHRFNPLSFVAIPEEGTYEGEPFFGASKYSETILDDGDIVEPDSEAIKILDKGTEQNFWADVDETEEPLLVDPDTDEMVVEDAADDDESTLDEAPASAEAQDQPEDEAPLESEEVSTFDELEDTQPEDLIDEVADEEEEERPSTNLTKAEIDLEQFISERGKSSNAAPEVVVPPLPPEFANAKGTTALPDDLAEVAAKQDEAKDSPFKSVRNNAPSLGPAQRPTELGAPPKELRHIIEDTQKPSEPEKPEGKEPKKSSEDSSGKKFATLASAVHFGKKWQAQEDAPAPDTEAETSSSNEDIGAKSLDDADLEPPVSVLKPTIVVSETGTHTESESEAVGGTDTALPDTAALAQSLGGHADEQEITEHEAQSANSEPNKKRPPALLWGLVAASALIAAGALWLNRGDEIAASDTAPEGLSEFNQDLTPPTDTVALELDGATVATEGETRPTVESQVAQPATETADTDTAPLAPETESTSVADIEVATEEPTLAQPLSLSEAQEAYASSGIWQRAVNDIQLPANNSFDSFYEPSLDPEFTALDAVALPSPLETDDLPLPPLPSPAPAGTTFVLDENGLVTPSSEGTINPDGILVISGPPSKRAAVRPADAPQSVVAETAQPDLPRRRPPSRPSDLAELFEKSQYGGRTLSQLAALKPVARPESEQIAAAIASASTAVSTSPLAVATSPAPLSRPKDFAALVEKAKADPANIAQKQRVAVQTKSAPVIPTRANVAKAATQKKAINTRKVALIGVFGTTSKRTALVRLPTGKYVNVEIGDRVDGGKVAAIGADELRYVKGGRNIILRMPPRG
ncbi:MULTISPECIES: hypothetical protein [Halocynthiibacter]|uniref:Uncharacterized protein n=1 Tax=Halocynthiibacter halioticoli TaxID=2986804 RepID=A0AAE3J1M2_9RHOB|nr:MULTISPECIES: hypothetical protein [Halocynthiibacter]MCV6824903.1 hypothetical protein [Halocynthiibacter halioticoli]MCW4057904.1 hypothetical protein [Halocynthiibacter sp. SDUM655004]